jgi:hypothetical protein
MPYFYTPPELPSTEKSPNARHHPPAHKLKVDESYRVAGRVHAIVRCDVRLEVIFAETSHLHKVTEQPRLERLIAVDGDG